MENKVIYQVYKSIEPFLHEEQGHIKTVTKQSRQAVQDNIVKLGITPQDHAEAMRRIAEIYNNTKTKEDFEKEIEKLNSEQ